MRCPCLNRSFAVFRASLRMMPTLDTIYEEVYDTGIEPDELKKWEVLWYAAQDDGWGQWSTIDYDYVDVPIRDPPGPPPDLR